MELRRSNPFKIIDVVFSVLCFAVGEREIYREIYVAHPIIDLMKTLIFVPGVSSIS